MRTRLYLRVGKSDGGKVKVSASPKPNRESLALGSGYNKRYLPTVLIGLDLDIDDRAFDDAQINLSANIQYAEPAAEIRQVIEEDHDEEIEPR